MKNRTFFVILSLVIMTLSLTACCNIIGHDYTTEIIEEATCATEGLAKYTCNVCGDEYRANLPLKEHSWEKSTCEKPMTCSVCGKTEGTALGHSYTETGITAPKFGKDGKRNLKCSVCGKTSYESVDICELYTEILKNTGTYSDGRYRLTTEKKLSASNTMTMEISYTDSKEILVKIKITDWQKYDSAVYDITATINKSGYYSYLDIVDCYWKYSLFGRITSSGNSNGSHTRNTSGVCGGVDEEEEIGIIKTAMESVMKAIEQVVDDTY